MRIQVFAFSATLTFATSALASTSKALSLQEAQKIAQKAEKYAQKKNWKVSIAIVNSEGNLLLFQRGDGSYSGSIESAINKARSSNAFQRPTSAFADSIKQGRLGIVGVHDILPIEGGIPIVLGGHHAGAIGISGAKAIEDEEVAKNALLKL